jgi:hypothetical protein
MTTHDSAPELRRLHEAANRVSERDGERPDSVVLRNSRTNPAPQNPHSRKAKESSEVCKPLKDMAPPAGLEPGARDFLKEPAG